MKNIGCKSLEFRHLHSSQSSVSKLTSAHVQTQSSHLEDELCFGGFVLEKFPCEKSCVQLCGCLFYYCICSTAVNISSTISRTVCKIKKYHTHVKFQHGIRALLVKFTVIQHTNVASIDLGTIAD